MCPVLEIGVNVMCSMISNEDKDWLEKHQRNALRIIFGFAGTHDENQAKPGIERLEIQRRKLFEKFCGKVSMSRRFNKKWLPENLDTPIDLRNKKKCVEFIAKTSIFFYSPEFKMRRYLNSIDERAFYLSVNNEASRVIFCSF